MKSEIEQLINNSAEIIKKTSSLSGEIQKVINEIIRCLKNGNKVIIFGNGGSAADAQHIAAELIGRYKMERNSIPAISFTTDTSVFTSLSNDYSFDKIFSRSCDALVNRGDVVIAISTSGKSKNVINGLTSAKKKEAKTIGLLGKKGGDMADLVTIPIIVDSSSTIGMVTKSAISPPFLPNNPIVLASFFFADVKPFMTFLDFPLVEMAITTSPLLTSASQLRLKILSNE
jgi:D-sedoheptulose 7-phosphate isomerase